MFEELSSFVQVKFYRHLEDVPGRSASSSATRTGTLRQHVARR